MGQTVQVNIFHTICNRLSGHTKMGIYYYDEKSEDWVYIETKNNNDKNILTAQLDQFHAVTIIQDLIPPKILKTYPANGGYYIGKDVKKISIKYNLFNKIVDYFYFYFSNCITNNLDVGG